MPPACEKCGKRASIFITPIAFGVIEGAGWRCRDCLNGDSVRHHADFYPVKELDQAKDEYEQDGEET